MRRFSSLVAVLLCVGALCPAGAIADDGVPEPLSTFPQSLLAIRTNAGQVINFKIWTADSPRREEQGLMYIRDMDEHAGMLFMFPHNPHPTMWMKNTYLPLDLLFINPAGRIEYIAAQATPLSLSIIQSSKPALAVLELKGGACDRLGIQVGDFIAHPNFHDLQHKAK